MPWGPGSAEPGPVPLGWLCTALPLLMGAAGSRAAFDTAAFEASHCLSLSPVKGKTSALSSFPNEQGKQLCSLTCSGLHH